MTDTNIQLRFPFGLLVVFFFWSSRHGQLENKNERQIGRMRLQRTSTLQLGETQMENQAENAGGNSGIWVSFHVTITAHPNSRTQENKAEGAADGYPPQELN